MATKYGDDIEFVREEIEDSGEAVTWRQIADGAPADSAKPWKPGAAVEGDIPVIVTFVPENDRQLRVQQYLKSSVIPQTLEVGLMASYDSFTPKIKDVLLRGTVEYEVWYIDRLAPDGTDVFFRIGLTR